MARQLVTRARLRKTPEFSIEGLDAAYDKMEELLNRISGTALKDAFLAIGQMLATELRARIPVRRTNLNRQPPPGQLRLSVFAARGKPTKPDILVGINRRIKGGYPIGSHGHLLEYGTTRMAARPFFRPTMNANRARVASMVAQVIKSTIENFK